MIAKAVEILLQILRKEKTRGLPLKVVESMLEDQLVSEADNPTELTKQAIDSTLDSWQVEKIIDYPQEEDELPTWKRVWFLRSLDADDSLRFQRLSAEKRAFLKLLYESENEEHLGAIRESDAIQKLRSIGFDVDKVPWISDKISTFYEKENDQPVIWFYLTPQDELSAEFKAAMEESERKDWERQQRLTRAAARDEEDSD